MRAYWIFCLVCISSILSFGQWSSRSFVAINADNGLPENGVNHIFQDHIGFIWIATNGGLVKYDGHRYQTYKPQGNVPFSLGGRRISRIIENVDGDLWLGSIGANRGLHKWSRDTDKFSNYYLNELTIEGSFVVPLLEDITGKVWLIVYENDMTYSARLLRLDPEMDTWKSFGEFKNTKGESAFDNISVFIETGFHDAAILQDDNGQIWIGGAEDNGLVVFDPETEDFTIHRNKLNEPKILPHNTVTALHQNRQGSFWIGTYKGLCRFDTTTSRFIDIPFQQPSSDTLQDVIFDINEDSEGNLWLIKNNQLDKFNVETGLFSIIFQGNVRPNGIPVNIFWIGEGIGQQLFFGMNNGSRVGFLNIKDGDNTKLKEFIPHGDELYHLNLINGGMTSREGILWLSNTHMGILKEQPFFRNFLFHEANADDSFTENKISDILEDSFGRIWISSPSGLKLLDPNTGKSWIIDFFTGTDIEQLFEDSKHYLWVGTSTSGLYRVDISSPNIFKKNLALGKEVKASSVESIAFHQKFVNDGDPHTRWATAFSDPQWLSIDLGKSHLIGMIVLHWEFAAAKSYEIQVSKDGKNWRTVHREDHGLRGIEKIKIQERGRYVRIYGTERTTPYGYSLHELEIYEGLPKFEQYQYEPSNPHSLGGIGAYSIFEDSQNRLWVGCSRKTLSKFNRVNNRWDNFQYHSSPESPPIINIVEDKYQKLWMINRCCSDSASLLQFDPLSETFNSFKSISGDTTTVSSYNLQNLYVDTEKNIWITTKTNGINLYDYHKRYFKQYLPYNAFTEHGKVMYEDSKKRLWVGTLHEGLFQLDGKKGVTANFSERNGLLSSQIYSILEDKNGALWLSTAKGVSRLNSETGEIENFSTDDGLISESYRSLSYKDRNGNLYFSGNNGLTIILPEKVFKDDFSPQVVISDFLLNSQLVNPSDKDAPLTKTMSQTNALRLSYRQNIIGFRFSALQYSNPANNQYAVMLTGVDPDWRYIGNKNEVEYAGLSPGNYQFKVKASNADGIWSEDEKSVDIHIRYPWWMQWWAWIAYALILFSLLFAARKAIIQQERVRSELKLKALETEKLQEVDQLKTRFFTNISHEFRTPLTLILGPIQQMRSGNFAGNVLEQYDRIIRNGNRLLDLINQLLDLAKLDAKSMKLRASKEDLVKILHLVYTEFEPLANDRKIRFELISHEENLEIYLDQEKFNKILLNLLSNAFKYTPDEGSISIELLIDTGSQESLKTQRELLNGDYAILKISDSGVGIPNEDIAYIFDRFYQVDHSENTIHRGTGVGLALVKELVHIHQGQIRVESKLGEGTSFYVYLPLGKAHLTPDELVYRQTNYVDNGIDLQASIEEIEVFKEELNSQIDENKTSETLVLVVEDSSDMQSFIVESLGQTYRTLRASDGKQGLDLATQELPDLIISDVMMPKMDGQELCSQLKKDQRTSHIPVILLTAKSEEEAKIEGLESGADDYITKPFSPLELQVRVSNLIKQRNELKHLYGKNIYLSPQEISITSADEAFLQKAIKAVEEHISDENFSVEVFANILDMSHQQVYRKIKLLTGQTPSVFIRTFRLKRAAQLLENSHITVAEAMYQSGFNHHSFFSKCFKDEFGVSPSAYRAKYAK